VGSKLAHSSPTLIAACHVLHRLYAPRHPRIALTSHLRVHTTNDNTGLVFRPTRNSAEQCSAVSWCGCSFLSLVWKHPIIGGQPDGAYRFRFVPALAPSTIRRSPLKPTPSRHRFEKPIHNVKKLAVSDCNTAPGSRSRVFIIRILASVSVHAVSRSKAAPCGWRSGGAYRDRTDDLMLAKQPLSQLS
jgi:hypothetical protein